jgi:hypothetical protein
MIAPSRIQRRYDHRLQAMVKSAGSIDIALEQGVPRAPGPRGQQVASARDCLSRMPWQSAGHMAKTIASGVGMTNAWLANQGVVRLKTLWAELAHLR